MTNLLLNPISVNTLLIVLAIVAVLAIAFAVFIVTVSKLCAVPVDEKEEKIKENLAGANCGGCGFAGCADFAKALAEGKAQLSDCGATPNENKAVIAEVLGLEFSAEEQKIAVVHCAGGKVCLNKFDYVGNDGCAFVASVMGGNKVCPDGCIGNGTCQGLCPFGAITVKDGVAHTDKALCENCGVCIKNCPKNIVESIPKTAKIYVACSSTCRGKAVMDACKVGCIGCGLCAKSCPQNAIEMINNHPVIDYKICNGCKTCISKCPRKSIREL